MALMYKHKHEPLISPRGRNPEISEPTSRLLERCLAKSPEERFQSFRELRNYLEFAPWDYSEDDDLAGYLQRYQSRRRHYLERPRQPELLDVYHFPGGRKLRILVGDIVQQPVDAIVRTGDSRLLMTGLGERILEAGGPEVCPRISPVRPGRVHVTPGGNLKAKLVFHAVSIGGTGHGIQMASRDVITEILKSCFYLADTYYVKSIAFPLPGSGASGFPEAVCLDTNFRFLAKKLLHGLTPVRDVSIVIREHDANTSEDPQRPIRAGIDGYRFEEYHESAGREVGDYIDYLGIAGKFAVVLADVPGFGIGAALMSSKLRVAFQSSLWKTANAAEAVTELNNQLRQLQNNKLVSDDRFVTLLLAIVDPATHRVTVVNAGHLPPLIRRSNRSVETLDESGDFTELPLGIEDDVSYKQQEFELKPGEWVAIYTDGLLEATNADGEFYGMNRLRTQLSNSNAVTDAIENVRDDLDKFTARRLARDDMSLICFGRE